MKGINISCSSHASTAIYTPISMDQPSSSSSPFPVTLGGSGGGGCGSRAIDRHNPIITDERRVNRTPPTSSHTSPFTPKPSPQKQTQKTSKKKNSSSNAKRQLIGLTSKIKTNHQNGDHHHHQIHGLKKGASKPSDLITVKGGGGGGGCTASKASLAYISPPESSRYLLDEGQDVGSGSLDRVLSDFDPVLKLNVPYEPSTGHELAALPKSLDGCNKSSRKPPLPPNSSSSNHQVVVLRVSLHCRGCEGKVRKHLSRMQGVTSFNIDFAAKKVTVVGEVTPLQVLASISKVKNAQLWTPPASAASTPFMDHKIL